MKASWTNASDEDMDERLPYSSGAASLILVGQLGVQCQIMGMLELVDPQRLEDCKLSFL